MAVLYVLFIRLGNGFFFQTRIYHERENSCKKSNSSKVMFFHQLINAIYVIFYVIRYFQQEKMENIFFLFNAIFNFAVIFTGCLAVY